MCVTPPAGESSDDTVSQSCHEGIELALKARESHDWKPLVDWLTGHPNCAGEVFTFLAGDQGLERFAASARVTAPPATVGRYELREVLGRGMGVVYRAFDPEAKREVAVKLLHPGGELSADERVRFRWEAEAVATLDHDNVVKLYDFGESDGVPYLVMPLMTGGSLQGWLKELGPERQLKPKHAAELARNIALGVHHAHQRGLIHRDLKPANILRDDGGRVRVADFGLARPADLTATRIAGTAAYMAPEQTGTGKRLTTAVDVHAVGVILFELLAGGPPFGGGDLKSVLRKVADEPAPPVRTYRTDVPRDLEAIVTRCLKKHPDDRYPSAAALADDLDNFLNGRPVQAAPSSLLTDLLRVFGRRAEPEGVFGWRGYFVGTVSTAFAFTWIQVAVLLDVPPWVSWAGLGYYLVSWAAILWVFLVRGNRHLLAVDRANADGHVGMFLGAVALTPVMLWLHGGDVAPLFAPLLVVVGLSAFAGGRTISGWYYLEGGLVVLTAAFLPLVPVKFWPGVYGLIVTLAQLRFGIFLRRFDRQSRAAPPS